MSKISVLGLGAMGSRMAAHLIKAGHDVTVWNRTADATKPLVVNRRPIVTPNRRPKGTPLAGCPGSPQEGPKRDATCPHERQSGVVSPLMV
jgi:hypothetical protein